MHEPQPTIQQYARHAERFGLEEVYETASAHLEPLDLGRLSLQLQRVHRRAAERDGKRRPAWKLDRRQSRRLAAALLREQLPTRRIAEMATCSVKTVRAIHAGQVPNTWTEPPEPALQSGGKWKIRPTRWNGSDAAKVPLLAAHNGAQEEAE